MSSAKPHPKGKDNPRGLKDLPFALPEVTPAEKRRARRIAEALDEHYPHAHCELVYSNPHELLIATILSAQSTDAGVNKATPALFKKFKTPADFAASSPEQIEPYIKTIGLYRGKARSIHEAMTRVVEDYGGQVPDSMEDLLTLRGVARKTANVVLGNAFDIHVGMPVDTHIQRLAWRFGLVDEPKMDPKVIEKRLLALFPRERWCMIGHQIIFHGRAACTARPNCTHDHPICVKFGVNCVEPPRKKK
ncbi:MAG: endonuclease III [Phycisphaerales bacterium]